MGRNVVSRIMKAGLEYRGDTLPACLREFAEDAEKFPSVRYVDMNGERDADGYWLEVDIEGSAEDIEAFCALREKAGAV